jgi:hypothetical protein
LHFLPGLHSWSRPLPFQTGHDSHPLPIINVGNGAILVQEKRFIALDWCVAT